MKKSLLKLILNLCRLFLWIFSIAVVVGTAGIILQVNPHTMNTYSNVQTWRCFKRKSQLYFFCKKLCCVRHLRCTTCDLLLMSSSQKSNKKRHRYEFSGTHTSLVVSNASSRAGPTHFNAMGLFARGRNQDLKGTICDKKIF